MAISLDEFKRLCRNKELISLSVAADMLVISYQSMYRLYDEGKVDGVRLGSRIRVYKRSVEEYFKRHSE